MLQYHSRDINEMLGITPGPMIILKYVDVPKLSLRSRTGNGISLREMFPANSDELRVILERSEQPVQREMTVVLREHATVNIVKPSQRQGVFGVEQLRYVAVELSLPQELHYARVTGQRTCLETLMYHV